MTGTTLGATGPRLQLGSGPLYRKLKPGPGHSAEEVRLHQRARVQGALIELADAAGYEALTVRGLSRLAGVSTRTFYRHYDNVDGCFAATYEWVMRCALEWASVPGSGQPDSELRLRQGLRALMEGLAAYPKAGRLVLVDAFSAGAWMHPRMSRATRSFERLLAGNFAAAEGCDLDPPVLRGIAAGVMRVIRTRLVAGRADELPAIADELADWILSLRAHRPTDPERASLATPNPGERLALAPDPVGDERQRILAAAARLGALEGYARLTIPRVRAEAGVSRRSFDERFASLTDCFLEAIETATVRVAVRAEREASGAETWEGAINRFAGALCVEFSCDPSLAHLAFVDVFAPGREGLRRRERLLTLGVERLQRLAPPKRRPAELGLEASLAAAWRIAYVEIAAGRGKDLPSQAPLLSWVVTAPIEPAATLADQLAPVG